MTKLELKSSHEVVYTVDVADVESIFYCKPKDPDILTVLMKDGKRLYCDEVCPVDSLQEEPKPKFKVGDTIRFKDADGLCLTRKITKIECVEGYNPIYYYADGSICLTDEEELELVEEPVSEDLEEVAKFYADTHTEWFDADGNPHVAPAFKAGAQWGKNQAMAEIQSQNMALAHGCPKENTSKL